MTFPLQHELKLFVRSPMSRNLYAVDVNVYFLIKIRGMQRSFEDILNDVRENAL